MSGGSKPPAAPNVYQFKGMPQAETGAQSAIGQMGGMPNYGQNLFNQYGSGLAGMIGPGQAPQMGDYLTQQGQGMFGQGNALMNMGLDPQGSLHAQAFQQNLDATRAGEAARGIAMTPYGAGLENMSNQQFENLWANQQAGRAAQLAGAAQGTYGQGAHMIGAGQALAPSIAGMNIGNLAGLQGAGAASYAQPQMLAQDWLNYLGAGAGADANAIARYNSQLNAWNAQNQQQQQMWGGIGQMAEMGAMAMMMMSDERVKEDIMLIGYGLDDMPIYRFRYIGDPQWHIGFIAQEVEEVYPHAVTEINGIKYVNIVEATGGL